MSNLSVVHRGRAWKFGDSVDTNQLAGGGLVGETAEQTLRINCLRGLRPDFTEGVSEGDILVAGTNFGCGSSRQTAVEALLLCGISAVLVESVARINRRNTIALALPLFVIPGITELVGDCDTLSVDYPLRVVRNETTGAELPLPQLPPSVEEIYEAGGLLQVIGARLAREGYLPTEPAAAAKARA